MHIFWNVFFEEAKFESAQNTVIVLDVSKSMYVSDTFDGSRLRAAKEKIYEIISENPSRNYALVIFAGESQQILPLTDNHSLFSTILYGVNDQNLTLQWTDIAGALEDAVSLFWNDETGSIVVFTDGWEENTLIEKKLVSEMKKKKLELYIIGVWSEEGWHIPTWDTFSPIKLYNGAPLVVKLEAEKLIELAGVFSGEYKQFDQELDFKVKQWKHSISIEMISLILSFVFWIIYLYTLYLRKYEK